MTLEFWLKAVLLFGKASRVTDGDKTRHEISHEGLYNWQKGKIRSLYEETALLVIDFTVEKSTTNRRFIKERRTDMDLGQ